MCENDTNRCNSSTRTSVKCQPFLKIHTTRIRTLKKFKLMNKCARACCHTLHNHKPTHWCVKHIHWANVVDVDSVCLHRHTHTPTHTHGRRTVDVYSHTSSMVRRVLIYFFLVFYRTAGAFSSFSSLQCEVVVSSVSDNILISEV